MQLWLFFVFWTRFHAQLMLARSIVAALVAFDTGCGDLFNVDLCVGFRRWSCYDDIIVYMHGFCKFFGPPRGNKG